MCADDEQRSIMQLELEYNGVAIIGIVGKWPKNLFDTINIGPTYIFLLLGRSLFVYGKKNNVTTNFLMLVLKWLKIVTIKFFAPNWGTDSSRTGQQQLGELTL